MSAPIEQSEPWPGLNRLGKDLVKPLLMGKRARNQACWADPENWILGFYFGHGDSRLWAPRRGPKGMPLEEQRVINFGHPLGRKAFRILMLAWIIGLIFAVMLILAAFGVRW